MPVGWWQVPWAPPLKPDFVQCPYQDRCNASEATGCINATTGPLCAVCTANYYSNSQNQCIRCTKETVPLKIGVLAGLFLFAKVSRVI